MVTELYSSPEVKGLYNGQCEQGLQPQPDMLSQDIWAMGCLIVMMMTGKDAFDFPGSSQYSEGALAEEVDKKHSYWVRLPPWAGHLTSHIHAEYRVCFILLKLAVV